MPGTDATPVMGAGPWLVTTLGGAPPARAVSLRTDERGAMTLVGVFLCMLAIGMLYYVVGAGQAITYRERMLDASDSAAFGGALLHARAMNVVVLLNQTTASVFAVAVAARAAVLLLLAAAAAAGRECSPFNPGACLAAVCLIVAATPDACSAADDEESVAREVAQNAGRAVDELTTATRLAAVASAGEIAAHFAPPVADGISLAAEMPLEPEDPNRVCDEVTAFTGPSGEAGDLPMLVTARHAYAEARRFAGRCGAESYVDRAGGVGLAILASTLVCGQVASAADGNTRRVTEGTNMGDDVFQVHAYVRADGEAMPFDDDEARVALVAWGQPREEELAPIAASMRDALDQSVSRAEYFFDGDVDPALWTWRMQWRARLRRLDTVPTACPFGLYACEELGLAAIH